MTTHELVLLGAGGLGREALMVADAAAGRGLCPIGFLDDDPDRYGSDVDGSTVLGSIDDASEADWQLTICTGSSVSRRNIARRLRASGVTDDRYTTLVHPTVSIPSTCSIGVGCVLLAGVVLTSGVSIGDHVVIMPNTVLTHDVTVGDFATLCAGVALAGGVRVGSGAYLGMNSSVREKVTIGNFAVLGMGSVLLDDVPAEQTWFGAPARSMHRPRLGLADGGTR